MLFRSIVTAIFAVAFSSTAVSALPSGAPKCAISSAAIGAGHKQSEDLKLGYSFSIAASGASWEFTITNSAGRKTFQGLLFYVTTSLDPSKHLGKFTLDGGKFRPQTKSVCDAAKIAGALEATITHADPSRKPVGTKFTWTPNPDDLTVLGDPILNFAVADNDGEGPSSAPAKFITGKVPFDFRPKTQPVPTAQPPAPTQPPPTTAPTTAPGGGGGGGVYGDQKPATTRKVIKCTPKKYSKTYSKPSTETVAPSIPEPGTGPGPAPAPGPGATPEPSSPVVLPIGGGGDGKPEPKAKGGYGKPEPKAKGGYGKPDSKAKGGYGGAPAPATKGGSY